MTGDDLNSLKKWFSDYTGSFLSSDEEDNKNYQLKIEHTQNVCVNILHIANTQSMSSNKKMLAEAIALFHDLGRFSQFKKYRTFMDRKSVNHGVLGAETLKEEKVLSSLPEKEEDLITQTVRFHNAFTMPRLDNMDIIFFLKLIRDADKLDVFRVFIDYYKSSGNERASAAAHGLPDNSDYSSDVLNRLLNGESISYSHLTTLNDFKFMHLSWVYMFNFKESCRLILERRYLEQIIEELPQTDEVLKAGGLVRKYLQQRLNENAEQ